MAKSSMQAANMRRANRRIEFAEGERREIERLAYQQRPAYVPPTTAAKFMNRVRSYISRIFKMFYGGRSKAIDALDLSLNSPRSIFNRDGGRAKGATWLRDTFGSKLRMTSTRDGRPV